MTSGEIDLPSSDETTQLSIAAAAELVDRLNRAGRWTEALAIAAKMFERFRHEPRACAGLSDALVGLGRADQAAAVLRDSQQRFPGEQWIPQRLAQLAASRRDWPEALAQWRAAGQPNAAQPDNLRTYAVVLANSGDPATALHLVTMANQQNARHRGLLLCEAELLLRQGKAEAAAALFPTLTPLFSWADPGFATLATQLVQRLTPDQAAPILAAMLDEADLGDPEWVPAVARALASGAVGDVLNERVRLAVKTRSDATSLACAVAEALTDPSADTDILAARVRRAVADGRLSLLPLLLETAGSAVRQSRLRIALRLYLNRDLADPAAFDALRPQSAFALLLIARVADADCLSYFAELARAGSAEPSQPDLSQPDGAVAQVAYASDRVPAAVPPASTRLRVALCVSGRLPVMQPATGLIRALRLQGEDAVVFAHVWRATGGQLVPPGLAEVLQRLPPRLRTAFASAAEAGGLAGLRRLYPSLLQGRPLRDSVETAQVRQMLQSDRVVVEDEAASHLAGQSPHWKARYSARQAHLLAAADLTRFDLTIHLTADAGAIASEDLDWPALARSLHDRVVVLTESGYQFDRAQGFLLPGRFAAGSPSVMDLAADSFLFGEQVAAGIRGVYGMTPPRAMAQSLAMQLHLNGVAAETVRGLRFGVPPDLAPLDPTAALALLWQDIRARKAASPDSGLVAAAMADVTGGFSV